MSNNAVHVQKTLDFEAPQVATESDHVATQASLPPPLARPDRQIVYPDASTHYNWPPAAELHDRDTITVDRITDDIDGPAHRFVIKRGDTVEAYMSCDRFHVGEVIGISHAREEVRVAWDDTLEKGGWFKVGAIYPSPEPEPQKPRSAKPLSGIIEQVNAQNAPPGGWDERDQVPKNYTFAEFKELWKNQLRYDSYADYRSDFERLARSRNDIVSELQSSYKAPQLKAIASKLGEWNAKQNTKLQNAESIFRKMLASFLLDGVVSFGMGESYEDAVTAKVRAVTQESWTEHFNKVEAARREQDEILSDPQTLYGFAVFIHEKGEEKLTNDQMARWDALHADLARERRAEHGPSANVAQFESSEAYEVEFAVKQGFHEKRDCPLWIVQLGDRVEKETYRELLGKAKQLGGWYSSFKKADAGFQFLSEDAATRFTGLLTSDANRDDILAARRERKEQTAAERLHDLAAEMLSRSEATIEQSRASLQNTARRADIQAGVRGRAYAEAALARTLHSVADALSRGEAKYLDGVRHRTHLEELDRTLRLARWARFRAINRADIESDYGYDLRIDEEDAKPLGEEDIRFAEYPYPNFSVRKLRSLVDACRDKRGVKQLSAKLAKRLPRSTDASEFMTFRHEHEIGLLSDLVTRAQAAGVDCNPVADNLVPYQRLQRAHIADIHELRAALREYLPHKASTRSDDPALVAERELIGKDLPGFFPTPAVIISLMLEWAEIQPGHKVLEPSCGKGDIVLAVRQSHPQATVTAIEMNHTLADVLAANGVEAEFEDFLNHSGVYDRIVMNPPFEKLADIDHVRHAFDCLAPGGRIVSVMSESSFIRSDKKSVAFQEWLGDLGGYSLHLPENSFAGADAFRQTGVRTRVVVVDKKA